MWCNVGSPRRPGSLSLKLAHSLVCSRFTLVAARAPNGHTDAMVDITSRWRTPKMAATPCAKQYLVRFGQPPHHVGQEAWP